jgi:hypothetical protein
MDLKKIFDNLSTQSIHEAFTVPVCRRIVWAIICDGRFFFSKVKLSQDLMPGTGWKDPPSSLLSLIMDNVMFAEQIMRPTFLTGLGDSCGVTDQQPRQPTRRDTTNRRLLTTSGRQQPRGWTRQPISTGCPITAKTQAHTGIFKPTRGKTPQNQSAYGPSSCKRFLHFG